MRIAVHQPNFLPWLGYFYKMARVDAFVLLDDVQYVRSYVNRTQVKTSRGPEWVHVPVRTRGLHRPSICDTVICDDQQWQRKLIGSIRQSYGTAPHFEAYFAELQALIEAPYSHLVDLNRQLLTWLQRHLRIETAVYLSSELVVNPATASDRIVEACRKLGATTYLSGFGGSQYHDEQAFRSAGITIEVTDFRHPVYTQLWGSFTPNLSAIDYLFNVGADCDLLRDCGVAAESRTPAIVESAGL